MALALLAAGLAAAAAATTIHVSPTGGSPDLATGSADRPYATLAAAQAAVRGELGRGSGQAGEAAPGDDVEVVLGAGAYYKTQLRFTEADSPRGGRRVIWRGDVGATVYGGARVTGWTKSATHNPSGLVLQAALPKDMVDAFGRARFQMLVQDERAAILARTPNFGSGFIGCSSSNADLHCPPGVLPADFDCVVRGPPGTQNASSACSVFERAGYSSDFRRVLASNSSANCAAIGIKTGGNNCGSVTFNSVGVDSGRGSTYLQGAVELIDQEGEWAVRDSTLYFWPFSRGGKPIDPETLTITAPINQVRLQ